MRQIRAVVLAVALPLVIATAAPVWADQAARESRPSPPPPKTAQPATAKPQPPPATTTKPQTPPTTPAGTTPPATTPVDGSAVGTTAPMAAGPLTSPANAAAIASLPQFKPPSDYVIGAGDVLGVVFWRQQEMSVEVVVRPDGRISIPLLNDIDAAGLTPEQLRLKVTNDAQKFVQDPNVTVVVKQINSRRVYITGQVARPGPYLLTTQMNVLQLLSMAGGLLEYADGKNIMVLRNVNGKPTQFSFNYKDIINRKNLKQNIELKPDDTVIVP